ncbi:MAG: Branched-chain amino acid transport system permease protein LivM, partial [uncultured Thermomicrobiales bacterium]
EQHERHRLRLHPRRRRGVRRARRPTGVAPQARLDGAGRRGDVPLPVRRPSARDRSPRLVHVDLRPDHPGDGPERRRRLRGAARPRLRRLLRDRRLHDRLLDLPGERLRPTRLRPGRSAKLLARHAPGMAGVGDLRRHPRRAYPAPPRRLPGDRDPRLRRDRAELLLQRGERHQRHPRHQPDRQARHPRLGRLLALVRADRPAQLVLADASRRVAHRLPDHPPLRLPPRPLLAGRPRGRDRRLQHGGQPGQDEALGLRPRRVLLRVRRLGLRLGLPVRPPQPVRVLHLRDGPGDGDPGRHRQYLRRHLRRPPDRHLRSDPGRGAAGSGPIARPLAQHRLARAARPDQRPAPRVWPRPRPDDAPSAGRPLPERQAPGRAAARERRRPRCRGPASLRPPRQERAGARGAGV